MRYDFKWLKLRAILLQFFPQSLGFSFRQFIEKCPETLSVIHLTSMRQFVQKYIVYQMFRQQNQIVRQVDCAPCRTTPPAPQSVYSDQGNFSNILSRTKATGFQNQQLYSDYFLEKGNFFRIDNISLGYTFKKLWDQSSSLRLTFGVQNVALYPILKRENFTV